MVSLALYKYKYKLYSCIVKSERDKQEKIKKEESDERDSREGGEKRMTKYLLRIAYKLKEINL